MAVKILLTDFNGAILDSARYFDWTVEFVRTGNLPNPTSYLHNIGLIIINSFFFRIFDGVIPLFALHKILSIIYSSIGLGIAFLFLKRYFDYKWALVGVGLLAFDWRMIQNVTLGITEPLFLIFVWSALYFSSRRCLLPAFLLAGMATIVRFEGLMLIPLIFVLAFEKKQIISFFSKVFAFFTPLAFVAMIPYKTIEKTAVFSGVISHEVRHIPNFTENLTVLLHKIGNSILYYGWSTFPNFIFLVPFGIYSVFKNRNYKILLCLMVASIPGLWAYLDAYDTRYFFMAFIFFDIISLYGLQEIILLFHKRKQVSNYLNS